MKRAIFYFSIAVLALSTVISSPSYALSYNITDLGTLGITEVYGINDAGQIVGYTPTNNFVYTLGVSMTYLDIGGHDINNLGQIAGVGISSGQTHAFLYTPDSGTFDLGTLGGNRSLAYGINSTGQVVGYSDLSTGYDYHAFLYSSNSGMIDLGAIGGSSSYAYGINDSGQVVGKSGNHAFLYTSAAGMVDIDTMGNFQSYAKAINNSGQAVGTYKHTNTPNTEHAFIYSAGSGMIDIGTLSGRNMSYAEDINNNGWVVGSSGDPDKHDVHAFVYNSEDGMIDLGTLGGLQSGAVAINDYGQIIGWSYTSDGYRHATLWTPVPEPASILTILTGIAATTGVALRRRCK